MALSQVSSRTDALHSTFRWLVFRVLGHEGSFPASATGAFRNLWTLDEDKSFPSRNGGRIDRGARRQSDRVRKNARKIGGGLH